MLIPLDLIVVVVVVDLMKALCPQSGKTGLKPQSSTTFRRFGVSIRMQPGFYRIWNFGWKNDSKFYHILSLEDSFGGRFGLAV